MIHWKIDCPYCGERLFQGTGGGGTFPEIWMPYFRCNICYKLISTQSMEYITIPPEERLRIRADLENSKYIAQSLDRTNDKKYQKFLTSHGYKFYPLTNEDYKTFKNVDWDKYNQSTASQEAIQSLYKWGILVEDEYLDKETGEVKKEIIKESQRNHELDKKANRTGIIVGLIVGILSCAGFSSISNNTFLAILGIILGIITHFAVYVMTSKYYEKKVKKEKEEDLCDNEDDNKAKEQKENLYYEENDNKNWDDQEDDV